MEILNLKIECPICGKKDLIQINKDELKKSDKGLSSVLIDKSSICEHKYLVFIDVNGKVRGTQTPDYMVKIPSDNEKNNFSAKSDFEILNLLLNEEIFCKLFRTGLLYNEICIITDNKFLDNLKNIFGNIFGDKYKEKVIITSLNDYNKIHQKRLLSSEFQNSFTINLDYRIIIKQPYNDKFQEKDFTLEMSILNEIKLNTLNNETIIKTLKSKYDLIFEAIIELKQYIEKKILSNRSKIDEWINKLLIKKIPIKANLIYEILRNRYNIIII